MLREVLPGAEVRIKAPFSFCFTYICRIPRTYRVFLALCFDLGQAGADLLGQRSRSASRVRRRRQGRGRADARCHGYPDPGRRNTASRPDHNAISRDAF